MSVTAAHPPRLELVRADVDRPARPQPAVTLIDRGQQRRSGTVPPAASAPALGRGGHGRLRATPRGRLVVVLLAIGVLAAVVLGVGRGGRAASPMMSPVAVQEVTVLPGQTLWSLAAATQPDGDIRDRVAEIRQLNRLESSGLYAGQQLLVPLP